MSFDVFFLVGLNNLLSKQSSDVSDVKRHMWHSSDVRVMEFSWLQQRVTLKFCDPKISSSCHIRVSMMTQIRLAAKLATT